MPIDYARAKAKGPALKAALTRATKKVGTEKYPAVLAACKQAVGEWEHWEAWPDAWSHWQRALDDAACHHMRLTGTMPAISRLENI